MSPELRQRIVEAALMVAGKPLSIAALMQLFSTEERPTSSELKASLVQIKERFSETGIELQEVASGYRFQTRKELSPWLSRLWDERAPRYSRAFLETLAIIAYKQPVTRAEIEEIRGVTVSSHIIKTLMEREWVKIVGYRDVPGKPAIYGTSKQFLDYFNLKSLADMPTLAAFKDIETQDLQVQLALEESDIQTLNSELINSETVHDHDEQDTINTTPEPQLEKDYV